MKTFSNSDFWILPPILHVDSKQYFYMWNSYIYIRWIVLLNLSHFLYDIKFFDKLLTELVRQLWNLMFTHIFCHCLPGQYSVLFFRCFCMRAMYVCLRLSGLTICSLKLCHTRRPYCNLHDIPLVTLYRHRANQTLYKDFVSSFWQAVTRRPNFKETRVGTPGLPIDWPLPLGHNAQSCIYLTLFRKRLWTKYILSLLNKVWKNQPDRVIKCPSSVGPQPGNC